MSKRKRALSHFGNFRRLHVGFEKLSSRELLAADIGVYGDTLLAPWQNYSWNTEVNFNQTAVVAEGQQAMEVSFNAAWAGLYLSLPAGESVASTSVEFSIHGGATGGQQINVYLVATDGTWVDGGPVEPIADTWSVVSIPFSQIGGPTAISGIVWQEFAGSTNQPSFLVDDVKLASGETQCPTPPQAPPAGDDILHHVYTDSLQAPWQNWSWGTNVDLQHGCTVNSGASSISARHNEPWSGLYLSAPDGVASSELGTLHFSVHGGLGGQTVGVYVINGDGAWLEATRLSPAPNTWAKVEVDLEDVVGSPQQISGLVWQEFSGSGQQNSFFVDDVYFTASEEETPETRQGPRIQIDPAELGREINDDIYGLNFADEELARDVQLSVDRWGGNSTTRYNYLVDAANRGSDWYFENHPSDTDPSALPFNSSLDQFIQKGQSVGADSVVTVGTIGWTTKDREIVGGFSVDKYGPQQDVDPYRAYGNGIRPDGSPITGNDPFDTSIPIDANFTKGLVSHLTSQYGTAAEGGVEFYALDNEPMLWNSTHRDVHPEPASYDEVLAKGVDHAAAIKSVDASAQVLGPTVWGWTAYFYSALDAAGEGAWWTNPLDRNAHGGEAFIPWYLGEMQEAEAEHGQRLLDYLDIHYYPQTPGVTLTREAGNSATQQDRLESTRSLWDPNWVDESWINEEVRLIPRMREWIDAHYPGTKLAITEYNFGGTADINGAVTQADVLGIFGREGVDLATMWSPPTSDDPTAFAFRMYRNYDGDGEADSQFGELSVKASSADSDLVSVFAAQRSEDDALTIMLVNKSTANMTTPIELPAEFHNVSAELYNYGESNLSAIRRLDDLPISNGTAEVTLPASSITLLELPLVATAEPINVQSLERGGSPGELSSIRITFDGAPAELELQLWNGGTSIDLSTVQPTWNSANLTATWDLSSLNLQPGRYTVTLGSNSVNVFRQELLIALPGDANLDGRVDFTDFRAIAAGLRVDNPTWANGDFNEDSRISVTDLLAFVRHLGQEV